MVLMLYMSMFVGWWQSFVKFRVCAHACVRACVFCVGACVRARVCVCVCSQVRQWSGHWRANQRVAGLIPTQDTLVKLLFLQARNFTRIAPAVKWGPGINWGNSPPSL